MTTRAKPVERDEVLRCAARLKAGERLEALDIDGRVVRAEPQGIGEFVLLWGDEPGCSGDAVSIARFFLVVSVPQKHVRTA
jgi:hypothetical protein